MPFTNKKPSPPAETACCDSACNPCVWDNYYAKLRKWRIEQVKINEQLEAEAELQKY